MSKAALALVLAWACGVVLSSAQERAPLASVAPAPSGEPLSTDFAVSVEGKTVPVYLAQVSSLTPELRQKVATPLAAETAMTSFASFDLRGPVEVTVTCPQPVTGVRLLPTSSGIAPTVSGNRVTFTVAKPGQLVLEVNGEWVRSLQLFMNPWEAAAPDRNDPNVIYFGPGLHEVEGVKVTTGQTVYLAPGAVVYGKVTPGASHPEGAIFSLEGDRITLRGRGIIDGSRCPFHTRPILFVHGKQIEVEGVVLRDSSIWTMPVRQSEQVHIGNLKIFGWRGNSDGIDLCNSRQVVVEESYLRTFDDLVVVKADKGQGEASRITVRRCVLWNEFAHALSLGAELREKVEDVLFTDCDIVHDKGREWLLRVYNCDSGPVRNITFENIRIEEARKLISLWIGKAIWSREDERGHIDAVVFRDIAAPALQGREAPVALQGFDAAHGVHGVRLERITIGGRPLDAAGVKANAFADGVTITP